jgi:hypothetical protein
MEKRTPDVETGSDLAPQGVELTLPDDQFIHFLPLLQKGFWVKVRLGCSVESLLGEQLGLPPEFIQNRIKTIFLDGKPVDELRQTFIGDRSILALSAAMPGLAGAALRRGNPLGSFRGSVPPGENRPAPSLGEGFLGIRLFNLLIRELGPTLLARGIFLPQDEWEELRKRLPGVPDPETAGREKKGQAERLESRDGQDSRHFVRISVHFRS